VKPSARSPHAASRPRAVWSACGTARPSGRTIPPPCGGLSAEAWEAWPTPTYEYSRAIRTVRRVTTARLRLTIAGARSGRCATSPRTWPSTRPSSAWGFRREAWARSATCASSSARARAACGGSKVETSTGLIRIHAHSMRQVLRRGTNANAILRSNLFKIAVRRDPRHAPGAERGGERRGFGPRRRPLPDGRARHGAPRSPGRGDPRALLPPARRCRGCTDATTEAPPT
jgi:hypothetical protein